MKKSLLVFAAVGLMAACHNDAKVKSENVTVADTAATNLALRDNGQTVNMNGISDTLISSDGSKYVKVGADSATAVQVAPPVAKAATTNPRRSRQTHRSGSGTASSSSSGAYSSNTGTSTTSNTTVQKKKGWSSAAKGAVIGAGTGAVAGAIISKKKGLGAVVGGALGAGGGYIIGRQKDKKSGRVVKQ